MSIPNARFFRVSCIFCGNFWFFPKARLPFAKNGNVLFIFRRFIGERFFPEHPSAACRAGLYVPPRSLAIFCELLITLSPIRSRCYRIAAAQFDCNCPCHSERSVAKSNFCGLPQKHEANAEWNLRAVSAQDDTKGRSQIPRRTVSGISRKMQARRGAPEKTKRSCSYLQRAVFEEQQSIAPQIARNQSFRIQEWVSGNNPHCIPVSVS